MLDTDSLTGIVIRLEPPSIPASTIQTEMPAVPRQLVKTFVPARTMQSVLMNGNIYFKHFISGRYLMMNGYGSVKVNHITECPPAKWRYGSRFVIADAVQSATTTDRISWLA